MTMNLLSNALKFSPPGSVIEIGGKIKSERKNFKLCSFVEIYVKDNG